MKAFVFCLTIGRESTDRCFLYACYGNPNTSPPEGAPDQSRVFQTHSQEERQQYRMGLAQRPIANRERLANDLVSVFSHAWDPFPHFIATLSAQDWHKPCYHAFGFFGDSEKFRALERLALTK
jgi:hypothetical protein